MKFIRLAALLQKSTLLENLSVSKIVSDFCFPRAPSGSVFPNLTCELAQNQNDF